MCSLSLFISLIKFPSNFILFVIPFTDFEIFSKEIFTLSTDKLCSSEISFTSFIFSTVLLLSFSILAIILFISWAALLEPSANFLISSATTAKPFPASPALAASIDAFKANRFVCSAIEDIVPIILEISLVLLSNSIIAASMFLIAISFN